MDPQMHWCSSYFFFFVFCFLFFVLFVGLFVLQPPDICRTFTKYPWVHCITLVVWFQFVLIFYTKNNQIQNVFGIPLTEEKKSARILTSEPAYVRRISVCSTEIINDYKRQYVNHEWSQTEVRQSLTIPDTSRITNGSRQQYVHHKWLRTALCES